MYNISRQETSLSGVISRLEEYVVLLNYERNNFPLTWTNLCYLSGSDCHNSVLSVENSYPLDRLDKDRIILTGLTNILYRIGVGEQSNRISIMEEMACLCRNVYEVTEPWEKGHGHLKYMLLERSCEPEMKFSNFSDGCIQRNIYCGQCEYDKVTTLGTTWCTDCSEGYCNDCLKSHKAAKPSRNHHVIPISEYMQAEKFSVSVTCPTHQKKLDFFCRDHESILCVICVQQKHSKCNLLSLTEASQGVKTSTALTDLFQNMECILTNIEKGIQCLQGNQADIRKQEKSAMLAIRKVREQINQRLDSLQEKIVAKLKTKSDGYNKEHSALIISLTQKKEDLCGLKDSTTEMKKVASELQAFIWIRNMLTKVRNTSEEVKPLINNIQEFGISFQSNEKVTSLVDVFDSFGQVLVTPKRQVCQFVDSDVVQAQDQRDIRHQGIDNMRLCLRKKYNLKANQLKVTSCLLLPDKKLLFINQTEKNLIILNEDGTHHGGISVPYNPFDATVIDNQRIAITYDDTKCKEISIVNVNSKIIEKSFSKCFKNWTWGISHYNKKLYFVAYGEGIKEIDLNGRCIRTIYIDNLESVDKLTTYRDRIYYSGGYRVTCIDFSGKVIWSCDHEDEKGSSQSLGVCSSGAVLVTGRSNNTVLAISMDGKNKTILFDKSDGLNDPSAIHIDNNNLLVCNRGDGHAFLYEIIY